MGTTDMDKRSLFTTAGMLAREAAAKLSKDTIIAAMTALEAAAA